jgi:putative addiction module killer protein
LEILRLLKNYISLDGKDVFNDWLTSLRDRKGRAVIRARLDRIQFQGNFGNHRSVGHGVYELKIDFGPGYRVYYAEEGGKVVLLLGGGDKGSQDKDIRKAHERWVEYRNRP